MYSRERINDILFKYGKLSAAFNETEPEELVDKVLRMCTGSESEKVEHLNRDAQKAKGREERLRDEILQLQRKREEKARASQRPMDCTGTSAEQAASPLTSIAPLIEKLIEELIDDAVRLSNMRRRSDDR